MPLKTHQDDLPALNLTPMIDVVFLLIIFFMVGTKFTDERDVKLKVPAVGQAAPNRSAKVRKTISVQRDGRITFSGDEVTLAGLPATLQTALADSPDLSVTVRGDAEGSFQNVASVLAACRTAGIHDMSISVRVTR